nr:hypothetical protein CFP56_01234 [Quercus suber]
MLEAEPQRLFYGQTREPTWPPHAGIHEQGAPSRVKRRDVSLPSRVRHRSRAHVGSLRRRAFYTWIILTSPPSTPPATADIHLRLAARRTLAPPFRTAGVCASTTGRSRSVGAREHSHASRNNHEAIAI